MPPHLSAPRECRSWPARRHAAEQANLAHRHRRCLPGRGRTHPGSRPGVNQIVTRARMAFCGDPPIGIPLRKEDGAAVGAAHDANCERVK